MTGDLRLSERERAVLEIIGKGGTPTGIAICRAMINDYHLNSSPQGAHRTAASLVRKGLVRRAGTDKLRWYEIRSTGRALAGGYPDQHPDTTAAGGTE